MTRIALNSVQQEILRGTQAALTEAQAAHTQAVVGVLAAASIRRGKITSLVLEGLDAHMIVEPVDNA